MLFSLVFYVFTCFFTYLYHGVSHRACIVFYRAMLCIRGTSHEPVPVCVRLCLSVSVRLSQVGVLLKRLNVEDHKNNTTIVIVIV